MGGWYATMTDVWVESASLRTDVVRLRASGLQYILRAKHLHWERTRW